MKQAAVRSFVGFDVGLSELPDKHQFSGISGLRAKCRECRVLTGEETPGDSETRDSDGVQAIGRGRRYPQLLHIIGLA